jgi:predicted ribosome quality control (RQC) complex YloA/Tae2 family protein
MTSPGSLNYKEIDCILNELKLVHCRVQGIYQPSPAQLIFEMFCKTRRFRVLFVFQPQCCRLHMLTRPFPKAKKPQRFVSFLRAHIRNKIISSAEQLGKERIIKIQIQSREKNIILWVRLWSAAPNLIVTDQHGTIMDALYRKPKRGEISGGHFSPEGTLKKQVKSNLMEYSIREFPGKGSFNKRVEDFYYEHEYSEQLMKLRNSLLKQIAQEENRLLLQLENIQSRSRSLEDYNRYKQIGDMIMSSLHMIKRGDRWFKTQDYYHNDTPLEISLKPELTPSQNATSYYNKYKKARNTKVRLEKDLRDCRHNLNRLQKQKEFISQNNDVQALTLLHKKSKAASPPHNKKSQPGLHFCAHGFTIIVGRNAKENETLLRTYMRGNDYWFHCRDYPGSYVFVKSKKSKTLPLDCILDAGNLALHYSKAKTSGQGDVYYTQVKYLKKIKGSKPGLVIPTQEKNVHIKLDQKRLKRLKDSIKVIVEK